MIIIGRIEKLLAAGLPEKIPDKHKPVETIGDLLKPFKEFYDSPIEQGSYNQINNPRFKRSLSKSPVPLSMPAKSVHPQSPIAKGIFMAMSGVWDYYIRTGLNEAEHLELPLTERNLEIFTGKMFDICGDYYPMVMDFENEEAILDQAGLCLYLPSNDGNSEETGTVEALFSGHEELAGALMHIDGTKDCEGQEYPLDLSCFDRHLVDTIGYKDLMEFYYHYEGDKHFDQRKAVNCYENYFSHLELKYPGSYHLDRIDIVVYDSFPSIEITCGEDIAFAIDYADAWDKMINSMPRPWAMEQREDNECEDLVKNVCAVWRKGHL